MPNIEIPGKLANFVVIFYFFHLCPSSCVRPHMSVLICPSSCVRPHMSVLICLTTFHYYLFFGLLSLPGIKLLPRSYYRARKVSGTRTSFPVFGFLFPVFLKNLNEIGKGIYGFFSPGPPGQSSEPVSRF